MNLDIELMGGRRRRRRAAAAAAAAAAEEQPAPPPPVEYVAPEMMGAFRRIKRKMKNLNPAVKKQIAALMASPLPPITKRLLIARLIRKNKPMNLKKILKGMAIAASFGAGAGVATAIVAKRAIARRKARQVAERNAAPATEDTPENVTSINSIPTSSTQTGGGSISSSQTGGADDQQDDESENGEPPTPQEVETVQTVASDVKKKNIIIIGAVVAGAAGLYLMSKKKKR